MENGPQTATPVKKSDDTKYVYQDRRYVGRKETLAYVLFDVSQSFNINAFSERFIFDVLHIDFAYLAILNLIGGVWDVINDVFIGTIVDKTRTRWGKFKPYLIIFAVPGTILGCLYWMMPLFFPGRPGTDVPKFMMYFILAIVQETMGTFRGVSQTGMLSTITPHPVDRTRLITLATVMSGFLGERIPELMMTLMIDGINMGKINLNMESTYVFMGVFTTLVSGGLALYFLLITRERIMQSIDRPSIMQGVKSILNNRPILLMTLADFLGSFSIGTGMSNYYIDVLGSASIKLIVGIPGGFVSTPSFAWVPWFRRHFSTKALWLIGSYTGDVLMVMVFLFGSIGGRTNGLYKRRLPMIIAIMIQETLFMFVYGVRRVIPTEMYNEAMDYCEWKNGYRTEGMTGVARGLASKLVRVFGASLRAMLMKAFGYEQGKGYLMQTDSTKYFLFAMATVIPFLTGSLSIIPKLFYNLTGKTRDKMYEDLLARRAKISKDASGGDADAIARAADGQKNFDTPEA